VASEARFTVGQLVRHQRFGYRGVVADVDPVFGLSEAWYEEMARSRPPKDRPWYHVLVDDSDQVTYVAERHLDRDPSGAPVRHPLLDTFFAELDEGRYRTRRTSH
jgi:heat shock protein HspQ